MLRALKDNIQNTNNSRLAILFFIMIMMQAYRQFGSLNLRLDLFSIIVFLLACAFFIPGPIINILRKAWVKYLMAFALWICVVNAYWTITLGNGEFVFQSIIYLAIAGFFTITMAYVILEKHRAVNILLYGTTISLFLITFYVLVFSGADFQLAFFENKNQLGRFGLSSASIIALLQLSPKLEVKLSKPVFYLSLSAAFFLSLICMSRANILGMIVLMAIVFFIEYKASLIAIVLTIVLYLFFYSIHPQSLKGYSQQLYNRFVNEHAAEDRISGRGYDRFLNFPAYAFLGAGEALPERFDDPYEFHSTFGNLLFAYGIPAFVFFILFLKNLKLHFDKKLLFLLPILTYGLVHNDIKNIYFWLMLIILHAMTKINHNDSSIGSTS